jgi:hypothetical protein
MPKSSIGTSSMDKKALKAVDICRIIDKCIQRRVAVLKFGDLYVKFQPSGPEVEAEAAPGQEIVSHKQSMDFAPEKVEVQGSLFDRIQDEVALFDKEAATDAALSQLMIEDPAAYEKLQMLDDMEVERVSNEKV